MVYVNQKLGRQSSQELIEASEDQYGGRKRLDQVTKELCGILSAFDDTQMAQIVYNAKDKNSRALADRWEEHQEVDRIREEQEAEEKRKAEILAGVLKKLSPEEQKIFKQAIKEDNIQSLKEMAKIMRGED